MTEVNSWQVEFRHIPQTGRLEAFPIIYLILYPENLEVHLETIVPDNYRKENLNMDGVKEIILEFFDIIDWEVMRDEARGAFKVYGIIRFCKMPKVAEPCDPLPSRVES